MYVPVEVLGAKGLAVLDSGTTVTTLDQQFEGRLGKVVDRPSVLTASSATHFQLFRAPEMKIGLNSPQLSGGTGLIGAWPRGLRERKKGWRTAPGSLLMAGCRPGGGYAPSQGW